MIRAYFPDDDEGKLEVLVDELTNASRRGALPKQGLVVLETAIGDGKAAEQQVQALTLMGPDKATQEKMKRHLQLAMQATKRLASFSKGRLKSRYTFGTKRATTVEYGIWEKPILIDGIEAGVLIQHERLFQQPGYHSWTGRWYSARSNSGLYKRESNGTVVSVVEPLVEMSLTGMLRGRATANGKKLQAEFEQLKQQAGI